MDLRRATAGAVALCGLALVAWSAWIYHFAAVADTTDESVGFWLVLGTVMLLVGAGALAAAVRALRRAR